MLKISFILLFTAFCLGANYAPNTDASMITISVDEKSLQELFNVYENLGYHDFGTSSMLENIDEVK